VKLELFPKQELFFNAANKINVYSGGIQSAKTTTGALRFLYRGLLTHRDPTDNFLIAADTYKTLSQATIPTFMKFARPYGHLNAQTAEFTTRWNSHIYFRTGTEPDSVEGIPNVRRVWLDEGGKVSLYFFENLMGRAARVEAPVDITSTPYSMNWLSKMCLDAQKGKRSDVTLVHCKSIESPYFSKNEYERQKRLLDPRRFAMKYDGIFGQMEGLVFDIYEECLIPTQPLPPGTTYYAGVDWGYFPDPFALVVRALTPDNTHYRVAEYYRNYLTINDIVPILKSYDGLYHFKHVICDPSQPASIEELCRQGIPASAADNELRYGIDVHYGLMKSGRFAIFEEHNPVGIDEYSQYHYREKRELQFEDDLKERDRLPVDQSNHGIDADRYVSVALETGVAVEKKAPVAPVTHIAPTQDLAKRIAWLKKRRNQGEGAYSL